MRIEVTAEDIADGLRNSAYECPIALACKRVGVPVPFVETDQVSNGVQGVPAPLPREARDFIDRYDDGEDVEPFAFEINEVPFEWRQGLLMEVD
jgi:hypothetical protein